MEYVSITREYKKLLVGFSSYASVTIRADKTPGAPPPRQRRPPQARDMPRN